MKGDMTPLRYGAVRVVKGPHAGKIGYYDDDEGDHAAVYFGEPIHEWRLGKLLIRARRGRTAISIRRRP